MESWVVDRRGEEGRKRRGGKGDGAEMREDSEELEAELQKVTV